MQTLFDQPPVFPEGFQYYKDFLTVEEEEALCASIGGLSLHTFTFQGFEAKRRVESYGYNYHFDSRRISKGKDIPQEFEFILNQVAAFLSLPSELFAHMLVTEYPPGSVINWHRDAPPFDIIVGVSLASDCIFRLRPYDKAKQGRKSILSLSVERRSLYIIQGEARTDWEHSILPVRDKRYSLTFRTLRPAAG